MKIYISFCFFLFFFFYLIYKIHHWKSLQLNNKQYWKSLPTMLYVSVTLSISANERFRSHFALNHSPHASSFACYRLNRIRVWFCPWLLVVIRAVYDHNRCCSFSLLNIHTIGHHKVHDEDHYLLSTYAKRLTEKNRK